jgi:hypothetical protein
MLADLRWKFRYFDNFGLEKRAIESLMRHASRMQW